MIENLWEYEFIFEFKKNGLNLKSITTNNDKKYVKYISGKPFISTQ